MICPVRGPSGPWFSRLNDVASPVSWRLSTSVTESVAAAVARSTTVPLLVACHASGWRGAPARTVVPVNGCPSAAVLPVVAALAEPHRTRIHLVHALGPGRQRARRDAEPCLAPMAAELQRQGLLANATVAADRTAGAIARFAARVDADLTVVATRGEARAGVLPDVVEALSAGPRPMLVARPGTPVPGWPLRLQIPVMDRLGQWATGDVRPLSAGRLDSWGWGGPFTFEQPAAAFIP
jgi:hypothetical protein